MSNEYEFESVSLKRNVASQLSLICDDAKRYKIFISKSELLEVMLFDKLTIQYAITKIISERNKAKNPYSG